MQQSELSRRDLLKAGAATGTMAAAAVTLSNLAAPRVLGANERINLGLIGAGNMGTIHLKALARRAEADNVRCVAVCDVYQKRLTQAVSLTGGEGYLDYRRLLERSDIQAVLIAAPDHWHARMAMDAMDAGKHVFCEKPLTHTVEQALQLRDAVRHSKQVLQVGPNATADDACWQARQAIQDGRIGKVTWAQASYNRNKRECAFNAGFPIVPGAGPHAPGEDYVDWDMWLGHRWGLAPKIPWNPEHFFRFRKYWPYNGGVATDLLYHRLAPLLIAIAGPNGEYPLRVVASGGQYVEKDGRDIPDTFMMTVDYPSDYSVMLVSTLTNDTEVPSRIYGKFGTLDLGDEPRLRANGEFVPEFKAKNGDAVEARLERQARRDLVGNFLDVIRGEGTLHCNAELGAATMVAIKMGVEAYRQRRTLTWDARKERVVAR